jgi:hypothetical protein
VEAKAAAASMAEQASRLTVLYRDLGFISKVFQLALPRGAKALKVGKERKGYQTCTLDKRLGD